MYQCLWLKSIIKSPKYNPTLQLNLPCHLLQLRSCPAVPPYITISFLLTLKSVRIRVWNWKVPQSIERIQNRDRNQESFCIHHRLLCWISKTRIWREIHIMFWKILSLTPRARGKKDVREQGKTRGLKGEIVVTNLVPNSTFPPWYHPTFSFRTPVLSLELPCLSHLYSPHLGRESDKNAKGHHLHLHRITLGARKIFLRPKKIISGTTVIRLGRQILLKRCKVSVSQYFLIILD